MHLLCPPFFQIFYYFSGVRQKIPLFVLFLTLCEQSAPLSYSLVTQSEPLPTAKSLNAYFLFPVCDKGTELKDTQSRHDICTKKIRDNAEVLSTTLYEFTYSMNWVLEAFKGIFEMLPIRNRPSWRDENLLLP